MTTYKRVKSVKLTLDILEFLSKQKEPVSGNTISEGVKLPYGTTMCYLATLGDRNCVNMVDEFFELGLSLSIFWARKKAKLNSEKARLDRELSMLGTNN